MFFSVLFWPGVHISCRFLVFATRVLLRRRRSKAWTYATWFLSVSTAALLGLNALQPQGRGERVASPDGALAALKVRHISNAGELSYREAIHIDTQPGWFQTGQLNPVLVLVHDMRTLDKLQMHWDGPDRLRISGDLEPGQVYCHERHMAGVEVILEAEVAASSCGPEAREQRERRAR
jgi:hypothetical protein